MTTTTIVLSEPAEKGTEADFIRQTLQHALQRLMEWMSKRCAKPPTASAARSINSRNGYRDRAYETRPAKST